MALTDILEKQSDERKREKRLVHFTNALNRDFLALKDFKKKSKEYLDTAEYVVKSFLDFLFFDQHKEIRELSGLHVEQFLLDFAPRKLVLTDTAVEYVPDLLTRFLMFLETMHHITNGVELSTIVKNSGRAFLKAMPTITKTTKRAAKKTSTKKISSAEISKVPEPKVGRNDPCPCGSGKKYKKCCGRL